MSYANNEDFHIRGAFFTDNIGDAFRFKIIRLSHKCTVAATVSGGLEDNSSAEFVPLDLRSHYLVSRSLLFWR